MNYNIAIDGPAGAGKSSMARALADRLEFVYVDTGAIYRTVGLYAMEQGMRPGDTDGIIALLPRIEIDICYGEKGQRMLLNGRDVSDSIRTQQVAEYASVVAAIPQVRSFLLEMQRKLASSRNVIMDGRDIGTVVLPSADVKIFLTASPQVRAKRRWAELQEKGSDLTLEQVLQQVMDRDYADSHRAVAPLRQAEDAILVDTSDLSLEDAVDLLMEIIRVNIV